MAKLRLTLRARGLEKRANFGRACWQGFGSPGRRCTRGSSVAPRIAGRDGLSVRVIEHALILAATRRLIRPADAPSLGTIRSLAYFLPVIEEMLELRVSPDYFQYLRHKLEQIAPTR